MSAVEKNDTWELMSLPKRKSTMGYQWVFTIKQNLDGTIERNKERLVAKGFTQAYGVDYHETFALIVELNNKRVLLSLAENLGWPCFFEWKIG